MNGPQADQVPLGCHDIHQLELSRQAPQQVELLAAFASDFDGNPQLPTVAESKREERMSQPPPSGKWFDEKVEPLELREIVAALEMGHCEIGRRTVPAITNSRDIHAVSVKPCRRQHGLVS